MKSMQNHLNLLNYKLLSIVICIITLIYNTNSFGQNCTPINTKNDDIILKSSKPIQVSFYNNSLHTIYINRTGSSAWSSMLSPAHWSLLTIHDKKIHLTCVESLPGHEQIVPCHKVIELCQYNNVPKNSSETHWLLENSTQLPEEKN